MILFAVIISVLFVIGLKTPVAGIFSKDIVTVLKPFLATGIVLHHLHGEAVYMHEFERWGPLIVGIFFFISGYGLMYSCSRTPDYMKHFFTKKILIKLLLPFMLALGFSACLNSSWSEYSVIGKLTAPSGPSLFSNDWFLYALVYCYLAFMVSGKLKSVVVKLSFLVMAPALLVIVTKYMGYARNWWVTPMAFSVGALYCHFEPALRPLVEGKKRYVVSTLIALCVLGILMGFSAFYKSQISIVLAYSLLPLLLVNVMIRLDIVRLAAARLILFFGGISFEIYLLHGIIIDFLRGDMHFTGFFLILSTIALTLLAAIIFKQISLLCQRGISFMLPRFSIV